MPSDAQTPVRSPERKVPPWVRGLALGVLGGIAAVFLAEPVGRATGTCDDMFGCAGGVAIIAFVAGLVTGGLVPGWRSALGLSIGLCAGGGIGSAVMSTPTPYDIGLATKIFTGVEYVATFGLLFALAGFGLIALARSLSKAMRPTPE